MALELRKRHQRNCTRYTEGAPFSRVLDCRRCVYYAYGTLNGKKVRESLDTTERQEAARKLLEMQAEGSPQPRYTVRRAIDRFLKEREDSGFRPKSLQTYRYGLDGLAKFLAARGVIEVRHVTADHLSDWKATWSGAAARTKQKRQERLGTFFDWCRKRKYIDDDPTEGLTAVRVEAGRRQRFTDDEVKKIFAAIPRVYAQPAKVAQVRAFLLVLRYTALRIGDVTNLQKSHIRGDRVFLYTTKTGQPVYTVVPASVVKALDAIASRREHYFYPGNPGTLESWKKKWSEILKPVYRKAGVKFESHAWRDTLVYNFLRQGMKIETISRLLGHSSISITWRHYAAWVPELQEQLESAVRTVIQET